MNSAPIMASCMCIYASLHFWKQAYMHTLILMGGLGRMIRAPNWQNARCRAAKRPGSVWVFANLGPLRLKSPISTNPGIYIYIYILYVYIIYIYIYISARRALQGFGRFGRSGALDALSREYRENLRFLIYTEKTRGSWSRGFAHVRSKSLLGLARSPHFARSHAWKSLFEITTRGSLSL